MIPDFRYFIERVRSARPPASCHRSLQLNDLARVRLRRSRRNFSPQHRVEIIASMPCYSAENVNAQRGEGVFEGSIAALQLLNSLGYGIDSELAAASGLQSGRRVSARAARRAGSRLQTRAFFAFRHCVQQALCASPIMPIGRFAALSAAQSTSSKNTCSLLVEAFNPTTDRRADVPQHDQRRMARRGLRLRFQSAARHAMG